MSTETGRQAESAAADFLEDLGFQILARNWRNRWCEIDIIARRSGELHLVEVKYRRHHSYGGGVGAVTPDKIRRLQRAALAFGGSNKPVVVDVAAVSGRPGDWQIELIENAVTAD